MREGAYLSNIRLPYTDTSHLSFRSPDHCIPRVYQPRATAEVESLDTLLEKALNDPLGSKRIEERVRPDDKVLIVCDDLTRPTPADKIIPPILRRLELCGVRDSDIEILFALGTHRLMTQNEMKTKVGEAIFRRISCANHDAFDKSELRYFGTSEEGIAVWLNRRLKEASFVIGIGDLVPHPIAGYGGGAKILYPGVAGEETIAGFHVSFGLDPLNYYGSIAAPARASIDRLAAVVGLDFLVNTVLAQDSRVYATLAGDHKMVYEVGLSLSREIYGVPAEHLYNVVVVSSYPAWSDFWQGGKGIYSGATLAKPGGDIILVTACPEGLSKTHQDFGRCIGMRPEDVAKELAAGRFKDAIGAAIAVKVARLREQYRISLVSDGLGSDIARMMGFERYERVEDALAAAWAYQGPQDEIGVIPYGGHTYCYSP